MTHPHPSLRQAFQQHLLGSGPTLAPAPIEPLRTVLIAPQRTQQEAAAEARRLLEPFVAMAEGWRKHLPGRRLDGAEALFIAVGTQARADAIPLTDLIRTARVAWRQRRQEPDVPGLTPVSGVVTVHPHPPDEAVLQFASGVVQTALVYCGHGRDTTLRTLVGTELDLAARLCDSLSMTEARFVEGVRHGEERCSGWFDVVAGDDSAA